LEKSPLLFSVIIGGCLAITLTTYFWGFFNFFVWAGFLPAWKRLEKEKPVKVLKDLLNSFKILGLGISLLAMGYGLIQWAWDIDEGSIQYISIFILGLYIILFGFPLAIVGIAEIIAILIYLLWAKKVVLRANYLQLR